MLYRYYTHYIFGSDKEIKYNVCLFLTVLISKYSLEIIVIYTTNRHEHTSFKCMHARTHVRTNDSVTTVIHTSHHERFFLAESTSAQYRTD